MGSPNLDGAFLKASICLSPGRTGPEFQERLKNVTKPAGLRLFVFSNRRQFIRTVPALSRDRVNMDNVYSLAEVAVAMISDLLVLK